MERRKCTREFNVETVPGAGVTVAQAARDFGVQGTVLRRWVRESAADTSEAFPGQGQMKPEQVELALLRRAVIKLKTERDIFEKAVTTSRKRRSDVHLYRDTPRNLAAGMVVRDAQGLTGRRLCLAGRGGS